MQSIFEMLLSHEKRIVELEEKTDNTQVQVDQNQAEIEKIQENIDDLPPTTIPQANSPIVTEPISVPNSSAIPENSPTPQLDPNSRSWETSHGTFVFKDIGSRMPMWTSKEAVVRITWSSSNCPGFREADINMVIPVGTRVVSGSSLTPPYSSGGYFFDLSEAIRAVCPRERTYFFNYTFGNDPSRENWPGNFGLWW